MKSLKKLLNILKKTFKVLLTIIIAVSVCFGTYETIKDYKQHLIDEEAKENFVCDLSKNVTEELGYKPRLGLNLKDLYIDHLIIEDSIKYLNFYKTHTKIRGTKYTLKTICVPKQSIMDYCEANWNYVFNRLFIVNKSFQNCISAFQEVK